MTTTTKRTTTKATTRSATPAPHAPVTAETEHTPTAVCAFCGEGREPKREPLLPAALYIASLAVEPPYASTVAHLSCARAHREQRDAALTAHSPRRSATRSATRVAVQPRRSFSDTAAPFVPSGSRVAVKMRRQAALALGLTTPFAYWGHIACHVAGTDARGRATVYGTRDALLFVASDAEAIACGDRVSYLDDAQLSHPVRAALRLAASQIRAMCEASSDSATTSTFTF